MNREQKAAQVDEVAAELTAADAVFAVDYRGITVPQAAELRERLGQAGAHFRVVKNTLTLRAADKAGADDLKAILEGPTALAFVDADRGDVALAAKALSSFRREHGAPEFKGGRMAGEPLTVEQIRALATLPAREVLHGHLVGVVASPITGLVRGLNQLIAGLALQLRQIADEGMVPRGGATAEEPAAPGEGAATDTNAQAVPGDGGDAAGGKAEPDAGDDEEEG